MIGDTARIAGGEKGRDGLAYEALNLMPNPLSLVFALSLAGAQVLLGADQRDLGAAGARAGARVAVGDVHRDVGAGVRVE